MPTSSDPSSNASPVSGLDTEVFTARFEPDGSTFAAPTNQPLLRAAEAAGVKTMDNSCRNGTCRTCLCLLESGQVRYRIDWPGVSPDERREGWILPCIAYPISDVTVRLPV